MKKAMDGVLYEGDQAQLILFLKDEKIGDLAAAEILAMISVATNSKSRSYAPYSHFNVGAAVFVEKEGGRRECFGGTNQENATLSLSQHGEMVAIARARYEGFHKILGVAATGLPDSTVAEEVRKAAELEWVPPCGHCRQVINETATEDCIVVYIRGDGKIKIVTFASIFPDSFGPKNLGINPAVYTP